MSELLLLIRDLCLRRRGPQDMPYSLQWLAIFLLADLLLNLFAASVLGDVDNALPRFLLLTAFELIVLNIALSLRELRPRFVQSAIALIACDAAFTVLVLPLNYLQKLVLGPAPAAISNPGAAQVMIAWLSLGVYVWQVMVNAHILRNALNLPAFAAYVTTLLWVVVQGALLVGVFGDTL